MFEAVKVTHYWDSYRGWISTNLRLGDFKHVEILGENKIDGIIFIAWTESGRRYILCDRSDKTKFLR